MAGTTTTLKKYHDEDFSAKDLVEGHFSHRGVEIIDETMVGPAKKLHEVFSSGLVNGDKLLVINAGAMVYPLFSASNVCKNIYVMDVTESSVNHFKQWLNKGDEATDWSFASKFVCQLEGNPDGWKDKEEQARRAVKGVYKFDQFDEGSNSSVAVPQVDCLLSVFFFNVICHTKEDFKKNMKTYTSWLKIGGRLIFTVTLNMTFYMLGDDKFAAMTLDENYVRETVANTGFVIEKEEVIPTSVKSNIVDFKNILFLVALKKRNI